MSLPRFSEWDRAARAGSKAGLDSEKERVLAPRRTCKEYPEMGFGRAILLNFYPEAVVFSMLKPARRLHRLLYAAERVRQESKIVHGDTVLPAKCGEGATPGPKCQIQERRIYERI